LIEGTKIKFGVTEAAKTGFSIFVPMLVLRKKMPPFVSTSENGPCYQIEQHFWKN
jgi:hypothetical protein